ncbi:MAG: alpha/beta hydrolase [Saprospiraceae bacterium]|nr:alpha/beta hydrolase [Saprospiraceae bacterium]
MNIRLLYWLLRRKRFYFSLALLGFLAFAYKFLEFRQSNAILKKELREGNPFNWQATFRYYAESKRKIRYLEIGNDTKPLIVFIHGAPSSISFWNDLLTDSTLLSKAKLMAVDRPGYGYSGYGRPEISVKEQARLIAQVLLQKRNVFNKIILHGSSYGGTVAARIAMDYPNLVDGLLLQSASVEPGAETTYDISYITTHWALEWLVPGAFKVANHEKLSHRKQLELMRPFWSRVIAPTIILQGDADELIFPSNANYAEKQLINACSVEKLIARGSGHDLLWTRRELLIASLMKLLGDTTYNNLNLFNR